MCDCTAKAATSVKYVSWTAEARRLHTIRCAFGHPVARKSSKLGSKDLELHCLVGLAGAVTRRVHSDAVLRASMNCEVSRRLGARRAMARLCLRTARPQNDEYPFRAACPARQSSRDKAR